MMSAGYRAVVVRRDQVEAKLAIERSDRLALIKGVEQHDRVSRCTRSVHGAL